MKPKSCRIDLQRAKLVADKAADLGHEILLRYFGDLSNISEKDQAGLVTEADLESEKAITALLRQEFPEIEIIGEEETYKSGPTAWSADGTKARWLIDPLDGTTNYVHRFPFFCISIGLEVDAELVLGLVDAPKLGVRYHAIAGEGAYRNGKLIKVSGRDNLKETLLATGFFAYHEESLQQQLKVLGTMIGKTRGVRRAGSAALDLCMVAEGIFDIYMESDLNPWDTAAGNIIVREAGGKVTNYKDELHNPDMKTILATNGNLHQVALDRISKAY